MRLRRRVLGIGSGLILGLTVAIGLFLYLAQERRFEAQMALRTDALVQALSVEATRHLASNRIEELDQIVSGLGDEILRDLEVREVEILDRGRRIMAHTDPQRYGSLDDGDFAVEASQSARPLRVESEDGTLLRVSLPLQTTLSGRPGVRWGTMIASVGLHHARAEMTSWLAGMLAIIVAFSLGSLVLSNVLLEVSVIRRVRELSRAALDFAAGRHDARARVAGEDEVAQLAHHFNEMADRIVEQTRGLEDQILARTRELEETNHRLSEAMDSLRVANAQLHELATTDGLTGLGNFRCFETALGTEAQRAARTHMPLSLLMIDVDHFKHYNDTNGHPAGDEVLREVARRIQARLRRTDLACRYGGEEFAVLLVDTDVRFATAVAEELRSRVAKEPFPGGERQPLGRLTISVGVASMPDHARDERALVQASDEALYRAKQGGRNRIEVAGEKPAGEESGTAWKT